MAELAPELYSLWEGGARHLEIGCGAANALLSLLASLPRMSAVGIEIDGGAIALARRRARDLGVEDRVEFRHADARDLAEEASFDSANWSQQFFPAGGRGEVLETAWRALKPGGYLLATMFGDPPGSAEALREPAGRSYALDRLAYGGWGVPVLGVEERVPALADRRSLGRPLRFVLPALELGHGLLDHLGVLDQVFADDTADLGLLWIGKSLGGKGQEGGSSERQGGDAEACQRARKHEGHPLRPVRVPRPGRKRAVISPGKHARSTCGLSLRLGGASEPGS